MNSVKNSKRIRVMNSPHCTFLEYWDYQETRARYANLIARLSPRGSDFLDRELIDFLCQRNSYCYFEIEYQDSPFPINSESLVAKNLSLNAKLDPKTEIHRIANFLINECSLSICGEEYRLGEIEFYLHRENHPDQFTHKHKKQKVFGHWYPHSLKKEWGSPLKGGNFKGIDLCLGDENTFFGILLRGMYSVKTEEYIDGPSLLVDELLALHGYNKPVDFINSGINIQISRAPSSEITNLTSAPRVGLSHFPTEENPNPLNYLFEDYRFLKFPQYTQKGMALLFLATERKFGLDFAMEKLKVSDGIALNRIHNCMQVTPLSTYLAQKKLSTKEFCGLYAAYLMSKKAR